MPLATSVPTRADVVPATPQRLWGLLAVLNFALGGAGAGFYLVAAVASAVRGSPVITLASWLGPALVLAGFAAVAAEAGQPFRGARVLVRIGSSWMSRELWVGGAFVVFAVLDALVPNPTVRVIAAVAALSLVIAQGSILRAARAIPAWSVPIMPLVFVTSAAVSGAALLLLANVDRGRGVSNVALGSTVIVLLVALAVWLAFLRWSSERAFMQATAPLRQGLLPLKLVGIGHVVPLVLAGFAVAVSRWAEPASAVAAIAMLVGQLHAKSALILTAGVLRPIALDLTIRRSS